MQTTKEGYLLTRNVMRVDIKRNRLFQFIKTHKVLIIATTVFLGLIIAEGILVSQFIRLLSFI